MFHVFLRAVGTRYVLGDNCPGSVGGFTRRQKRAAAQFKIQNHWCPGKIILIDEKTIVARVSWFCKSRGLASAQPDTSTLGDASFAVSFVLKLNNGMAEMPAVLS